MSASPDAGCTVCESENLLALLKIDDVPVFCNVQADSLEAARGAARGTIALKYCRECGHIFNSAFDPRKVDYSELYENSLHFSPRFQKHAEELVDRLILKYDLHHKTVVEIGCGKGEFISMLCDAGDNTGYGFDASYDNDRETYANSDSVEFIKDFYNADYKNLDADFVCCRHVLEHIQHPVPFLEEVQKASGSKGGSTVYFEVPNALYSIEDMGIWDLIYEHCSYFTPESAKFAFSRAGLVALETYTSFGNQFLCVEARSGAAMATDKLDPAVADQRLKTVQAFSRLYEEKLQSWNGFLQQSAERGERVIIWGAGSKGVTFLNCIDLPDAVSYVLDINPNKNGKFVAGTGHEIVSLEGLATMPPSTVIVMNPIYEAEIQLMLSDAGIVATTICA